MGPSVSLLRWGESSLAVGILAASLLAGAAAIVVALVLRTARGGARSVASQAHAAGIAGLLLLIYAAGECVTEGLTPGTVTAAALPLVLLGVCGLTRESCEELAHPEPAACRVSMANEADAVEAGARERTSENRRAA
ncbi:MAG: hypothetical protein AB7K52_06685 [Phycisphaerales bacterium]